LPLNAIQRIFDGNSITRVEMNLLKQFEQKEYLCVLPPCRVKCS